MSTLVVLPELIPLHEIPKIVPSTRPGKRIHLSTVYRWAMSGRLPSVKIAGGRYVTKDALLQLVNGAEPKRRPVPPNERARAASAELQRLLGKPRQKPLASPQQLTPRGSRTHVA